MLRQCSLTYLANSLRVGILSNGMIVKLLCLAPKLRHLSSDESKETLVNRLNIAFIREVFGGATV